MFKIRLLFLSFCWIAFSFISNASSSASNSKVTAEDKILNQLEKLSSQFTKKTTVDQKAKLVKKTISELTDKKQTEAGPLYIQFSLIEHFGRIKDKKSLESFCRTAEQKKFPEALVKEFREFSKSICK